MGLFLGGLSAFVLVGIFTLVKEVMQGESQH